MSSILSGSTIQKILKLRKYILRSAIWILVFAVVAGALTILFGGTSSGEIMLKFMGTLFIVALMMMISVNNFRMIVTRKAEIQIFALIGLVSNLCWAILWTLLCWNPDLFIKETTSHYFGELSLLAKFALAFSYLSALGLFCSNILSIYEGDKKGMIRPLKITAVVCIIYEMLYVTIMTFIDYRANDEMSGRFGALAGFVGFCWFFIVITALVLSKNVKNKMESNQTKTTQDAISEHNKQVANYDKSIAAAPNANQFKKTDDELRAEIEEKVRREMIEKEVRAKIEAEQNSKTE